MTCIQCEKEIQEGFVKITNKEGKEMSCCIQCFTSNTKGSKSITVTPEGVFVEK